MWICRGLVKGLQCPQCLAPSILTAADTNSHQHSHKTSRIDAHHTTFQHCQYILDNWDNWVLHKNICDSWCEGIWQGESVLSWNRGISRACLINIPTRGIFGNIPNFSSYLGISRACLINFPTTGKFGNMPNIPRPEAGHTTSQYAPLINPSGGRGAFGNLGISCIFAALKTGLLWGLISGR